MRNIIAIALILLTVSTVTCSSFQAGSESNHFDKLSFFSVVQGLLDGIGIQVQGLDVQKCIIPSDDAVQNILIAINSFEKEDATGVAHGLIALAKAFKDIPAAIQTCVAQTLDVQVLIRALEAISNPKSYLFQVGKGLLINNVDIYDEIYTAVDNFLAAKWKELGFNIGEALAHVSINGADN